MRDMYSKETEALHWGRAFEMGSFLLPNLLNESQQDDALELTPSIVPKPLLLLKDTYSAVESRN